MVSFSSTPPHHYLFMVFVFNLFFLVLLATFDNLKIPFTHLFLPLSNLVPPYIHLSINSSAATLLFNFLFNAQHSEAHTWLLASHQLYITFLLPLMLLFYRPKCCRFSPLRLATSNSTSHILQNFPHSPVQWTPNTI